jgi:hypothetical protein
MNIIPLHIQRRFEQRWAARFGLPAISAKSVGLKGSPPAVRRARRKDRRLGSEGLKSTSTL